MTTMTRTTVQVTCACGASFSREVKRGRPQIWCPTCVAIPFYDRVPAGTAKPPQPPRPPKPPAPPKPLQPPKPPKLVVVEEAPTPASLHDLYAGHRAMIEADVAAVYVDHAARYAARIADGTAFLDAASATSAETREALKNVYAKYPKVKPMKNGG